MIRERWKRLCAVVLALCLVTCSAWAASFTDVPAGAYYARAVSWAVEKGITNGTSATAFSPNRGCTRAHAVTFLWRADGSPEPVGSAAPFHDVAPNAYYAKAVQWAMERGITGGIDENTFGPDQPCSRAQIVTFMYRCAGSPSVPDGIGFRDVPYGVYYARAVAWAAWKGITQGTADGSFQPTAPCTRGQIVTFLHRYFAPQDNSGTDSAQSTPSTVPETVSASTQTPAPSPSLSTTPSQTPSPAPSPTPSPALSPTPSPAPSPTPSPAPSPTPSPAPVEQPVYNAAVEADLFRERLLSVINSVQDGGGYYTAHKPSTSFPRTSWDGLHEAFTLTGDRPSIDLRKARPSFCSAAVYLAMTRALLDWDQEGYLSNAAWRNLKPWCLDNLEWPYQHDGAGCWGRANANGPGLAALLAQLKAGESRYIGGDSAYTSRGEWLAEWDSVTPGDFVKIFWTIYIGADDSQNKGESGHLVVFLGREKAYLDNGTRDDWISYWSSNGSGAQLSGGYGKSRCRASKIRRAVVTHVTDPAAFANASKIAPDAVDAWLSALDGKHLATVAELKDAIAAKDMSKWLK